MSQQTLCQKIVDRHAAVAKANFRNRGGKHYIIVVLKEPRFHTGFDEVMTVVQFVRTLGYPRCYLTSGGPSGGTMRLNPAI